MHKHALISQQNLSDAIGPAPHPVPHTAVPNINIAVDGSNTYDVEKVLHAVQRITRPDLYSAPVPEQDHDWWGTPLEFSQMPNAYDARDRIMETRMHRPPSAMSMLCMRMKWGPYNDTVMIGQDTSPPFDHLSIHLGIEKAIVFIVTQGDPVTIEDDIGIFPSDALITQLRMLVQRQATPAQEPVP